MEFSIYPSAGNSLSANIFIFGMIGLMVVACILVTVLLLGTFYAMKNSKVILTNSTLELKSGIFSKKFDLEILDRNNCTKTELSASSELQPVLKTAGTALPGYLSGWFKLRNGSSAFLKITDKANVVHIPTNKNYSILLSVMDADRFIAELVKM